MFPPSNIDEVEAKIDDLRSRKLMLPPQHLPGYVKVRLEQLRKGYTRTYFYVLVVMAGTGFLGRYLHGTGWANKHAGEATFMILLVIAFSVLPLLFALRAKMDEVEAKLDDLRSQWDYVIRHGTGSLKAHLEQSDEKDWD